MEDNGSSIIIAGLLCFVLTGFLCCGESSSAPVSTAGHSGVETFASNHARSKLVRRE